MKKRETKVVLVDETEIFIIISLFFFLFYVRMSISIEVVNCRIKRGIKISSLKNTCNGASEELQNF